LIVDADDAVDAAVSVVDVVDDEELAVDELAALVFDELLPHAAATAPSPRPPRSSMARRRSIMSVMPAHPTSIV